jgi:hypothetical protein
MSLVGTIRIAYPVEIPDALRRLGHDLQEDSEAALDEIADGLVDVYKEEIEAVDAIDTRHFIDTVRVREASIRFERLVASDAGYSGIVEEGRDDTPNYEGRFPAARAIARLDPIIENAFDHQLARF